MKTTGSLQIKKGYYYAVLRHPIKDGTGHKTRQKWYSLGIKATPRNKAAAQIAFAAKLDEFNGIVYSDKILFTDWIDTWLDHHAREVGEITMQGYRQHVKKHIRPFFAERGIYLQEVCKADIQEYYDYLLANGLSANTVKHHKNVIFAALKYAVDEEIISSNPAAKVKLPRIEKSEHSIYTVEQVQKLLSAVKNEELYPVVYIAANFGLRLSEILGLEWAAVDLGAKTMTIKKTVSEVTEDVVAERTKTPHSRRTLPIPDCCLPFFHELKHQQLIDRVAMGASYNVNDRVCKRKNGTPFKNKFVSHKFPELLKKYNLDRITFHELRHTFASLLIASGESMAIVSRLLGHSGISITVDIYGHVQMDEMRTTMNNFVSALQA